MKSKPSAVSRVSVTVVLLDSMSTSPDCSAVKRCCEVSGTYFTLSASPKIAAATARQTSTFRPTHLPWLLASMKPAVPDSDAAEEAAARLDGVEFLAGLCGARHAEHDREKSGGAALVVLRILCPCSLAPEDCPPRSGLQATGQMKTAALSGRRLVDRSGSCRRVDQRIGGAYCRPPLVHSSFWPRAILSGEPMPTLRSKTLAVVTDLLDDVVDPLLVDPERLAHARRHAEDALDRRDCRFSSSRRRSSR